MKTIATEWASFSNAVMPANTSPEQQQEMRRAFYAGAHSMLTTVYDLGAEDVSEETGMATLDGLLQESRAFGRAVVEGRA